MQFQLNINTGDREKAIERFKKLLDEEATIELKKIVGRRTLSQNAFLHILITIYAIHFGLMLEEAKVQLKRCCPFMRYSKLIGEDQVETVFLKQTSRLDKRELGEFIDWIYVHSSKENCYLPTIEEYKNDKSTYDSIIRSHRQYL